MSRNNFESDLGQENRDFMKPASTPGELMKNLVERIKNNARLDGNPDAAQAI